MDDSKAFTAWLGTDGALRHKSPAGLLRVDGWPKLRAWRQCRGTPRRWLAATPLLCLTQSDDPSQLLLLGAARHQRLPLWWSPLSQSDWDELQQLETTEVIAETEEEADALLAILPQNTIVSLEPPGLPKEMDWVPSTSTVEALRGFVGGFPTPVRSFVGQFQTCSQWDLCRFIADDVRRLKSGTQCPAGLFQQMLGWMHKPTPALAHSTLVRIPAHQCCMQLFQWLGSLKTPALEALKGQAALGCSTALAAMLAQRAGRRLSTEQLRALDEMEQWVGPWRHPPTTILLTEELAMVIRQLR